MTSTQFDDWQAYYAVEPFGQRRRDLMTAIAAADNRDLWTSAGSAATDPFDYMPGYEASEPTEEEIEDAAMALARSMRGE